jgi:magnesium-transporting ATPase (P-type)
MKKINPWVVLLLNLVTLGIYSLFWTINRRTEMIEQYKRTIPHWWWLLLPFLTMLATGLLLLFVFLFSSDNDSMGVVLALTMMLSAALMLATIVILIWWIWKFLKAAEYVNRGRAPAGWIMAVAIFASPLHTLFLQHYFNTAEAPAKVATEPKLKPTRNFILLAILAIIAGIVFSNTTSDSLRDKAYEDDYKNDSTSQEEDGFYNRYY